MSNLWIVVVTWGGSDVPAPPIGWANHRWVATYRLFFDAYTVRPSATMESVSIGASPLRRSIVSTVSSPRPE